MKRVKKKLEIQKEKRQTKEGKTNSDRERMKKNKSEEEKEKGWERMIKVILRFQLSNSVWMNRLTGW